MSIDPRTPCVIGVAQRTVRPPDGPSPEPLDLWEGVCRAAAEDACPGAGDRVLAAADSLQIVYCMSWPYDAPVDRLAERLGIEPRHRLYSGIGGTTPQVLVQDAAEAILDGQLDLAVITGAEALDTQRRAKKAGERLAWSHRAAEPPPFPFEAPFHPAEVAHEVFQAWLTFPVFDVARRARLGVDPAAYQAGIGELLAPFSEVAAANPHAWFPEAQDAARLATPTPDNRIVGYPYTKRVVSIMDVDMAATVIVASHASADALGVPPERRAYLRGWCYATDPVYLAEHADLSASPAMAAAGAEALRQAGAGIDDVAHLDLYSCFASSVHLACDALGIALDDPRGLTVTGGLPFSGGAGSNYMLHSIATMVGVLRGDPGSLGLVTGVGMHMTKHVFGLYSTHPPEGAVGRPDQAGVQAALDAAAPVAIVDRHAGPASIASYTVAHGRDGNPEWGLVLGDVAPGEPRLRAGRGGRPAGRARGARVGRRAGHLRARRRRREPRPGLGRSGMAEIREAVIVDVVRTAFGKRGGALAGWHPSDLLGFTLRALLERTGVDPERLDDVVTGCVTQSGEQGCNVGRNAVVAAGLPQTLPATSVDRQCGSSQQALHFTAASVMSGMYDLAIACGVESMSRAGMASNARGGTGPFSPAYLDAIDGNLWAQFRVAQVLADRDGITREEMDAFAVRSHQRAAAATDSGHFAKELLPVPLKDEEGALTGAVLDRDEGIRPGVSLEKVAALAPAQSWEPDTAPDITAGNSSQMTDGAAAALIADRTTAEALGLPIRARLLHFSVAAEDAVLVLSAPNRATRKILERSGMTMADLDAVECNEAFAAIALMWAREFKPADEQLNPRGGAIAIGHPLGASGVRLTATLLNHLEATGGRYGLQTMCEGGGQANATIIERL